HTPTAVDRTKKCKRRRIFGSLAFEDALHQFKPPVRLRGFHQTARLSSGETAAILEAVRSRSTSTAHQERQSRLRVSAKLQSVGSKRQSSSHSRHVITDRSEDETSVESSYRHCRSGAVFAGIPPLNGLCKRRRRSAATVSAGVPSS